MKDTYSSVAMSPTLFPGSGPILGGGWRVRWEIQTVKDAEAVEVLGFYQWLEADEDRPEGLALASRGLESGGKPLGSLEVVSLVLTHAEAVANLVMLYTNWRLRPGPRPTAALTFRRAADGLSVTVDSASDEDVRQLMAVLSTPPPSAAPAPPP